jgi:hypothetical protein
LFSVATLVVGLVLGTSGAIAGPRAEVVVLWAPGQPALLAPVTQAGRLAGAAVIDATTNVAPKAADSAALHAGRSAYEALRFDDAVVALRGAAESIDATGGAGMSSSDLSDVFLYRALSAVQLGDSARAWDDFVRAAAIDPSRVLDPAQFPPRAVEQFERARSQAAALPRVTIRLRSALGCVVSIDGRVTSAPEVAVVRGRHWLVALCPGRNPNQRAFDAMETMELEAQGRELPALTDDAALVQARVIGAHAVLVVTVGGELALVRRLGIEGREQERRAVRVAGPSGPRELAAEVTHQLQPEERPSRWYRSRWAWVAAGAVAASAVLVPFLLQPDDVPPVVIRPTGAPW